MNIVDIKGRLHDKCVLSVMACSHYKPTNEKMNRLADQYEADNMVLAFACVDGETTVGVIVVKHLSEATYEIISIAVGTDFRQRGVGKSLVLFVAEHCQCQQLCAETDDEAVGFYRSCGFSIESLGETYPGIVRYLCMLYKN